MSEPIEALLPFYALGTLSADERAQVEAYLAENPAARAQLAEMVAAVAVLQAEATPIAPSPDVKEALLARVRAAGRADTAVAPLPRPAGAAPGPAPGPFRPRLWRRLEALFGPAFALGALAVILLSGAWALTLNARLADQGAELSALATRSSELAEELRARDASLAALEAENALMREALQSQQELLALLAAPDLARHPIAGTEARPGASGTLLVPPEGQTAVLLVAGLEALGPDRVYQFWLIGPDAPLSMGTLEVDVNGRGFLAVDADEPFSAFQAVGLSIEPRGGSEQPTGDIVLLGNLPS